MSDVPRPPGDPVDPTQPMDPVDPAVPPTTAMPIAGATPPGPPPIGSDPNLAVPNDPPPPWYKDNPAAVAVIVIGLIGIFLLIAWLLWWSDDDDDNALIIDSSTTIEVIDDITSGSVDTVPIESTIPETTVPESTVPATTEPITTTPPGTAGTPLNTTTTVAATTTTAAAATTTTAPAATTTVPVVTSPPNANATVLDIINNTPDLSRLRDLVAQAGIGDQLADADALTVFAPSNPAIEAFAATPAGAQLLADPAQLEALLLRHVVLDALDGNAVLAATDLETATGERLVVDRNAGTVDGGKLLVTDVSASNGFLHVVDKVLTAR